MAKSAIKRLVGVADRLRLIDALYGGFSMRPLDLVLSLHRISPEADHVLEGIHPKLLDEFIAFVKRRFHVASLEEIYADRKPAKPRVVFTFDDGYYDFMEHAMPVLAKHGVRANLNVIVNCVKTGAPMWNVRLYDFLSRAPRSLIGEIRLPGFAAVLTDDSLHGRRRYARVLMGRLKWLSRAERAPLWTAIEAVMERGESRSTRMMRESDVRQAAAVHAIGCHSCDHASFGAESDEDFQRDFLSCREYFGALSLPLGIYAFPNGSFRESQVKWLLGPGQVKQVLLVEDVANVRSGTRQVFSRLTLYGESLAELKFNVLRLGSGKPFSGLPA